MAITNIPEPGAQNRQRQDEAEKRQAAAEEESGVFDRISNRVKRGAGMVRRGILAAGTKDWDPIDAYNVINVIARPDRALAEAGVPGVERARKIVNIPFAGAEGALEDPLRAAGERLERYAPSLTPQGIRKADERDERVDGIMDHALNREFVKWLANNDVSPDGIEKILQAQKEWVSNPVPKRSELYERIGYPSSFKPPLTYEERRWNPLAGKVAGFGRYVDEERETEGFENSPFYQEGKAFFDVLRRGAGHPLYNDYNKAVTPLFDEVRDIIYPEHSGMLDGYKHWKEGHELLMAKNPTYGEGWSEDYGNFRDGTYGLLINMFGSTVGPVKPGATYDERVQQHYDEVKTTAKAMTSGFAGTLLRIAEEPSNLALRPLIVGAVAGGPLMRFAKNKNAYGPKVRAELAELRRTDPAFDRAMTRMEAIATSEAALAAGQALRTMIDPIADSVAKIDRVTLDPVRRGAAALGKWEGLGGQIRDTRPHIVGDDTAAVRSTPVAGAMRPRTLGDLGKATVWGVGTMFWTGAPELGFINPILKYIHGHAIKMDWYNNAATRFLTETQRKAHTSTVDTATQAARDSQRQKMASISSQEQSVSTLMGDPDSPRVSPEGPRYRTVVGEEYTGFEATGIPQKIRHTDGEADVGGVVLGMETPEIIEAAKPRRPEIPFDPVRARKKLKGDKPAKGQREAELMPFRPAETMRKLRPSSPPKGGEKGIQVGPNKFVRVVDENQAKLIERKYKVESVREAAEQMRREIRKDPESPFAEEGMAAINEAEAMALRSLNEEFAKQDQRLTRDADKSLPRKERRAEKSEKQLKREKAAEWAEDLQSEVLSSRDDIPVNVKSALYDGTLNAASFTMKDALLMAADDIMQMKATEQLASPHLFNQRGGPIANTLRELQAVFGEEPVRRATTASRDKGYMGMTLDGEVIAGTPLDSLVRGRGPTRPRLAKGEWVERRAHEFEQPDRGGPLGAVYDEGRFVAHAEDARRGSIFTPVESYGKAEAAARKGTRRPATHQENRGVDQRALERVEAEINKELILEQALTEQAEIAMEKARREVKEAKTLRDQIEAQAALLEAEEASKRLERIGRAEETIVADKSSGRQRVETRSRVSNLTDEAITRYERLKENPPKSERPKRPYNEVVKERIQRDWDEGKLQEHELIDRARHGKESHALTFQDKIDLLRQLPRKRRGLPMYRLAQDIARQIMPLKEKNVFLKEIVKDVPAGLRFADAPFPNAKAQVQAMIKGVHAAEAIPDTMPAGRKWGRRITKAIEDLEARAEPGYTPKKGYRVEQQIPIIDPKTGKRIGTESGGFTRTGDGPRAITKGELLETLRYHRDQIQADLDLSHSTRKRTESGKVRKDYQGEAVSVIGRHEVQRERAKARFTESIRGITTEFGVRQLEGESLPEFYVTGKQRKYPDQRVVTAFEYRTGKDGKKYRVPAFEKNLKEVYDVQQTLEAKINRLESEAVQTKGTRENTLAYQLKGVLEGKKVEGLAPELSQFTARVRNSAKKNEALSFNELRQEVRDMNLGQAENYVVNRMLSAMEREQASTSGYAVILGEAKPPSRRVIKLAKKVKPEVEPRSFTLNRKGPAKPMKVSQPTLVTDSMSKILSAWVKSMQELGFSPQLKDKYFAAFREVYAQGGALLMSEPVKRSLVDMALNKMEAELGPLSKAERKAFTTAYLKDLARYDNPFSGRAHLAPYSRFSSPSAEAIAVQRSKPPEFRILGSKDPDTGRNVVIHTVDTAGNLNTLLRSLDKDQMNMVQQEAMNTLASKWGVEARQHQMSLEIDAQARRMGYDWGYTAQEASHKMAIAWILKRQAFPAFLPDVLTRKLKDGNFETFTPDGPTVAKALRENIPKLIERMDEALELDGQKKLTPKQIKALVGEERNGVWNISNTPVGHMARRLEMFTERGQKPTNMGFRYSSNETAFQNAMRDVYPEEVKKASEIADLADEGIDRFDQSAYNFSEKVGVTDESVMRAGIYRWEKGFDGSPPKLKSQMRLIEKKSPDEFVTDRGRNLHLDPEYLDAMAFDLAMQESMTNLYARANMWAKGSTTAESFLTNVGNTMSHPMSVGLATGELLPQFAYRVTVDAAAYNQWKNNRKDFMAKAKNNPALARRAEIFEAITNNSNVRQMDRVSAELTSRTKAGKRKATDTKKSKNPIDIYMGYRGTRSKVYQLQDNIPRFSEVVRESEKIRTILETLEPRGEIVIQTGRNSFTRLFKNDDGIFYRGEQNLGKINSSKMQRIRTSWAVREVGNRIPNFRDVARAIQRARSGSGIAGGLFSVFTPFISFPYLMIDIPGYKKGILSGTVFNEFSRPSISTNSIRVNDMLAGQSVLKSARLGAVLLAFQQMRHPHSSDLAPLGMYMSEPSSSADALVTDSDGNYMTRMFRTKNSNAFESSILFLHNLMAVQAWMAATYLEGIGSDRLSPMAKKIEAQRHRGEVLSRKDLKNLAALTGGFGLEIAIMLGTGRHVDWAADADWGDIGTKALAPLVGTDTSQAARTLAARLKLIDPKESKLSPFAPIIREKEIGRKFGPKSGQAEWSKWSVEDRDDLLADQTLAAMSRLRFREVPIFHDDDEDVHIKRKVEAYKKALQRDWGIKQVREKDLGSQEAVRKRQEENDLINAKTAEYESSLKNYFLHLRNYEERRKSLTPKERREDKELMKMRETLVGAAKRHSDEDLRTIAAKKTLREFRDSGKKFSPSIYKDNDELPPGKDTIQIRR